MTIEFHRFYLLIISERLIELISFFFGLSRSTNTPTRGFAIFPCIIVLRDLEHPMTQQWINHERIHLRQNIESLGIFFIISTIEYQYARRILHYSIRESYCFQCTEQECYLNQHGLSYLDHRPLFNTWKYFRKKTKFHTDENFKVVIDDQQYSVIVSSK